MNRYQLSIKLMLLVEERKLVTLKEVLAHLYPNNTKINFNTFHWVYRMASGDALYSFNEKNGKKNAELDKACLENSDNYFFEFTHLENYENSSVRQTQPDLLCSDDSKITEQYHYADVILEDSVGLCGNKEKANIIYERLRCFTNYFASILCQKNYQQVSTLFCKAVANKYSVEYFEFMVNKEEKIVDSIKFYDNVQVCEVYNGEITDPDVDLFPLPKGSKLAKRVGVARFSLVFLHTPNGIPMFAQDVQIYVFEEEGRFKICNFKLVN